MLQTKELTYQDGDVTLEGYYAYDDATKEARKPGILIAHDWSGRNDFACKKAEKLAAMGYVGFAIDMFGNAKVATTTEEKSALITPFVNDRKLLLQRVLAGFNALRQLDIVNSAQLAAIGFCFGGMCVLDLARSGADLRGVVSFHGLLNPPKLDTEAKIQAKILVLHGYDDPMAPPKQLADFEQEMETAKADWQANVYGGTKHAFMNPAAHDDKLGTVYNPRTERRAWQSMQNFLGEAFE